MNKPIGNPSRMARPVLATAIAALLLGGCATTPVSPPGAADVRARLVQLQADPNLASRAPVAIREAEAAVRIAEEPVGTDVALGAHRVLMADRKVEIAKARAQTRYAEDQRARLSEERASTRLAARTREADQARDSADAARAGAADAAALAALEAAELRRQIEALEARETERGLVLTLGDVLFDTAQSDIKAGATSNLVKLAEFLRQYPERGVVIEGHTDNVGSAAYNQALSERRADAVKSWLMQQGIASRRMVTSGKGLHQPVADNATATGRQLNRRVEVIIEHSPVASSAR
ncbi:MAG: OmpA family protein [Chromatiales bacterium]|nr:OmpA family protein [Chromatiales bacterium]